MNRPAARTGRWCRLPLRQRRQLAADALVCAALLGNIAWIAADAPQTEAPASDAPLHVRQSAIREQMLRLEARLLKLAAQLGETEPEKAERVRDALDHAGRQRLKTRLEQLAALLRDGRLSESEQQQQQLIRDLKDLLELLTSPAGELDRQRERRKQLDAFQRAVRRLIDEQLQNLYRTQHAARQFDPPEAGNPQPADAERRDTLRQLEQLQRQTQQKAIALARELEDAAKPDRTTPGHRQVQDAAQAMRAAADQLGREQPRQAETHQQEALDQLQQALDELDESLRQVRREEMEETLDALEARLRAMLNGQRIVRGQVESVAARPPTERTRAEQMQLEQAAQAQASLVEDCRATLRIVVQEGSTVIVPLLLEQLAEDMQRLAERLTAQDASADTLRLADEIIALLSELLAAVEQKRDELTAFMEQGAPQAGPAGPQPLLPGSAELKLLRSSQLRLNERTAALEAATAPQSTRIQELQRLTERQRELADLAQKMFERQ